MRKEFEVYVEALTKNEAVGVAYMKNIAEKYGRCMFVKIVSKEVKPE